MRLLYPYNEILPKKKAHDLFLFQEAAHLAALASIDVTLLIGRGSLERTALASFYQAPLPPSLHIAHLPIVRKNNPLNLSWNWPFFASTEQFLRRFPCDVLLFSVLKQAHYHLMRKRTTSLYVYEAHELACYPHLPYDPQKLALERTVFERADRLIVTTHAMQQLLREPPYNLKKEVAVIPLATHVRALAPPSPAKDKPYTIAYVGQLYAEQGIDLLLSALALTQGVKLIIIGGKPAEVAAFTQRTSLLKIADRVHFTGFQPQHRLPDLLADVHAFVAPFTAQGRMPFVAHTKLIEYAELGRPIIAPDLAIVREHLHRGTLFFESGNPHALAGAIVQLRDEKKREQLQLEIQGDKRPFSWFQRVRAMVELHERPNPGALT